MSAEAFPAEFASVEPTLQTIRQGYVAIKVIKTPAQFEQAGELLKAVKGALKQIEDQRVAITKPINESLRTVNAQAKAASEPFQKAESAIKSAMVSYSDEQERLRREEQRKAEEAARKEREKLEAQAAKAAASGKVERAAELEVRAATVVAPVVQREAPKVAGITTREVWKFDITDAALIPREYLVVDESRIRKVVQALKGDTTIPGVRVYAERQLAAGAA